MKIFLTGAAGYIGARLAASLAEDGYDVIGTDRDGCPPDYENCFVDFVKADLLNGQSYRESLASCDAVFHLAAAKGDWGIPRAEFFRDNVEATQALLSAMTATDIKYMLFYSTVSVLGPSDVALGETAVPNPQIAYGESKAVCERIVEAFAARTNTHVTTIRPSVVFGPDNPWNTNIYRLIDAISRSRFIMIGDGKTIKTTSYIENLIEATRFIFDYDIKNSAYGRQNTYHYVDEPPPTTAEMVRIIRHRLGKRGLGPQLSRRIASPLALVGDVLSSATGRDFPITRARIEKFCTATNFEAKKIRDLGYRQAISLETAIDRTIDWHRQAVAGSRLTDLKAADEALASKAIRR